MTYTPPPTSPTAPGAPYAGSPYGAPVAAPAQQYGAPGAYPTAQPLPATPQGRPTNLLATLSLIALLIGWTLVSVILSAIALNQIKRTGDDGRVMALITLIASIVSMALTLLTLIIMFTAGAAMVAAIIEAVNNLPSSTYSP